MIVKLYGNLPYSTQLFSIHASYIMSDYQHKQIRELIKCGIIRKQPIVKDAIELLCTCLFSLRLQSSYCVPDNMLGKHVSCCLLLRLRHDHIWQCKERQL